MFEKKLLVASSHRSEAITKWILESESVKQSIDVIFIEELLDNFEIRDELDKNGPSIQWFDTVGNKYSNKTHYLLNRVINVEECLFNQFRHEDRNYAQREFEAYLGFALNAFVSPQIQAINGICERFKTLPQQWQMVKNIEGISIPRYYWGSPGHPFLSDEKNIVHSSIFDCLNWSTNQIYSEQESGFRFIKPDGKPLFVLSIGEKDLITFDEKSSIEQRTRIKVITQQIRKLFEYFIFELLLFVNEEKITFGCINIDIIQSAKNPGFNSFMQKHLVEESSKCLN
ncbi:MULTISPECIES: hypothetical protein [unclassified Legionella]|uniref:hypothetical protein n=1 Tax=unclassified Legionella TaxID=2622702 RepID=UPI0010556CF7|nr:MULTISPECIES: hypothetical protein [unclassified Legionella]MDI9818513.1 hypothetical protein [Legionella sp. PL877]